MHPEGGSWTGVRTHTPSKLSKVQCTFASHPLGLLQVSGERITAPAEPDWRLSPHPALPLWSISGHMPEASLPISSASTVRFSVDSLRVR